MDSRCKRRSLSQNSTQRTLDNKMANEDVYSISSDACADKMPMCYGDFATKTTSQSKSRGTLAARFEYHNFHAKTQFLQAHKIVNFQ